MSCAHPIPWATLVDYWAGELDEAETAALEEHLFGCADCTATSARVAAVTEAVREALPPVVSRARVDRLRARGLRVRENAFRPDERSEVDFTRGHGSADPPPGRAATLTRRRARRHPHHLRVDRRAGPTSTACRSTPPRARCWWPASATTSRCPTTP